MNSQGIHCLSGSMTRLIGIVPRAGESKTGFLARLAEANCYDGAAWICDLFGAPRGPGGAWSDDQVARLAEACSMDAEALAPIFRTKPKAGPGIEDQTCSPARQERGLVKVCPDCLREHRFHDQAFEMADLGICAAHGVRLMSACSCCGGKLRFSGASLFQCERYYTDLRHAPIEAADIGELTAASLIAFRAGQHGLDRPAAASEIVDGLIGGATDNQVIALLEALGRLVPNTADRSDPRAAMDATRAERRWRIAAGGRIIARWPDALFEALDDLGTRAVARSQHMISPRLAFLGAYRSLHDRCPSPAIAQAFVEFLSTRWTGVLGTRRRRRNLAAERLSRDQLTLWANAE